GRNAPSSPRSSPRGCGPGTWRGSSRSRRPTAITTRGSEPAMRPGQRGDKGDIRLVHGRFVLTAADELWREDSAVVVEGSSVREILARPTARAAYPEAEAIGSARSAVIPGLINVHHHSHAVTSIQHGLKERPLEPFLLGFGAVRGVDHYLDSLICGARMLSTGVTSAVDLFTSSGDADRFAADLRALRRGYGEAGLRVAVAAGMAIQSFLVYGAGEDERFIAALPAELRKMACGLLPERTMSEDAYVDVM